MGTTTAKHNMYMPGELEVGWDDEVGGNFEIIDDALPDTVHSSMLLNDEAEIVITPEARETSVTTVQGFGTVMIGQNQEYAQFRFDETGGVTLIVNTTNVDVYDNDGYLCLFMAGTGNKELHIKNRLGSQLLLIYEVRY